MSFLSLFNCDGLPPRSHPSQLPSLAELAPPPPWPYLKAAKLRKTFLLCSGDTGLGRGQPPP